MDSPRRAPLQRDLADAMLASIGRAAGRRSYRAGELISYEGDPVRAAYIIETGQVRVYRTSLSGREQVLAVLGEGDLFNVAPAFQPDGTNRSTVQALTDVSLFVIQRDELLAAIRSSPDLALALLRHLADRLDDLTDLVEYIDGSPYVDAIAAGGWSLDAEGMLPIPATPGLGLELDCDAVARYSGESIRDLVDV